MPSARFPLVASSCVGGMNRWPGVHSAVKALPIQPSAASRVELAIEDGMRRHVTAVTDRCHEGEVRHCMACCYRNVCGCGLGTARSAQTTSLKVEVEARRPVLRRAVDMSHETFHGCLQHVRSSRVVWSNAFEVVDGKVCSNEGSKSGN